MLQNLPLHNQKVVITAGPTFEPIDPVRFIGNYSSGKMGFCLAQEAANLGADVVLISGPTHLTIHHKQIEVIAVKTAQEMYDHCHAYFKNCDIAILAAAVADFKPKTTDSQKIKKDQAALSIDLEPTVDILESLGKIKKQQWLVGFALETENEIENAKKKIIKKNLDLIVLNSLNDIGAGFMKDTNKVTLIHKSGQVEAYTLKSKQEVAQDIFITINKLKNE